MEEAAGAGPHALGVVHVDRGGGQDDRAGARGVRGPQHRSGVAGVLDARERRDQPGASGQDVVQRTVEKVAHRDEALRGHRVRQLGQHLRCAQPYGTTLRAQAVDHDGVAFGGVRRDEQLTDSAHDDRLPHRLGALGQEGAGTLTRRASGQPPRRPDPLTAGVGQHAVGPGA